MTPQVGDVVTFRSRTSDVSCTGVLVAVEELDWAFQRLLKVWVESAGWARLEIIDSRVSVTVVRRPPEGDVQVVVSTALNRYDRFLGRARDEWGMR